MQGKNFIYVLIGLALISMTVYAWIRPLTQEEVEEFNRVKMADSLRVTVSNFGYQLGQAEWERFALTGEHDKAIAYIVDSLGINLEITLVSKHDGDYIQYTNYYTADYSTSKIWYYYVNFTITPKGDTAVTTPSFVPMDENEFEIIREYARLQMEMK